MRSYQENCVSLEAISWSWWLNLINSPMNYKIIITPLQPTFLISRHKEIKKLMRRQGAWRKAHLSAILQGRGGGCAGAPKGVQIDYGAVTDWQPDLPRRQNYSSDATASLLYIRSPFTVQADWNQKCMMSVVWAIYCISHGNMHWHLSEKVLCRFGSRDIRSTDR